MNLNGKHIVLTGASGGIGQATAQALDQQGAKLTLVGRRAEPLSQLASTLGQAAHIVVADLTTATGQQQLLAHCQQHPLDGLINNAGISEFAAAEQQDYAALLTTNLLVPMQLCQQLLPLLRQRADSFILNVGSAFGSIGYPGFTGYCASKFGLRGFSEALRREVGKQVRVLYFAPRATQTDINSSQVVAMNQALGTAMDSPARVAQALVKQLNQGRARRFLGFPEALFVRVNALLPNVVDNAIAKKWPTIQSFLTAKTE